MHDNFSEQADLYAQYRPVYPKAMYDFIFRHVPQKRVAWDCGTGSGQAAIYLAEHFEEVYANDISKEQLDNAPERENITYFNVPAENTGFPENKFDLITVAQAIHWFDFNNFYKEVYRTAKNKALLAAICYDIVQVDEELNLMIKKFYDKAFERYFGKNREYIDEQYQTIPFPFGEIEAPEFSMSYQWESSDLEGYFNSWSAVQKIKKTDGINPVDHWMEELKSKWPKNEVKEVTFPIFLRLGKIK